MGVCLAGRAKRKEGTALHSNRNFLLVKEKNREDECKEALKFWRNSGMDSCHVWKLYPHWYFELLLKQQTLLQNGFSKENHDVAVQDMDQVNHLLCDLLEREDVALAVEMQEATQNLRAAKLEAVHIEKVLRARKETNHNLLLQKVAAVDQRLKQRRRIAEPHYQCGTCKQHTSCYDHNSNYVEGESELMDSFAKLGDLQNQQKTLEDWYGSMSEQLQQEQLRLTLKFNELKMKLLEQKKMYLQASQECIDNLSIGSDIGGTRMRSPPSRIPQRITSPKSQKRQSTSHEKDSVNGSGSEFESPSASQSEYTDSSSCLGERTADISLISSKGYTEKPRKVHRNSEQVDHSKSDGRSTRRKSAKADLKKRYAKQHGGKGLNSDGVSDKETSARSLLYHLEKSKIDPSSTGVGRISLQGSSTPVGKTASEKGLSDKQTSARSLLNDLENEVRDSAKERLDALVQGYFTRKLMQTDKVQELLRVINDIEQVLHDLEREKVSKNQTKADILLKPTLEQELKNTKSKLSDIFSASTEEKINILNQTRLAAREREDRLFFKEKFPLSSVSPVKRLSSATIKRKQSGRAKSPMREMITRPYSEPPVRRSITDSKLRKSFDVRSMKSIPSDRSISFNQSGRSSMKSSPSDRALPLNQAAISMRTSPSGRSISFNQPARSSMKSSPSDRSLPFNQPARSSMKSSPSDRSISFNHPARGSVKSSPSDRSISFNQPARSMKASASDRSISVVRTSKASIKSTPSDRSISFDQPARASMKLIPSDRSIPPNQAASWIKSSSSDRSISLKQPARPSVKSSPSDRSISFNQSARPSVKSSPSDRSISFNQPARSSMKSSPSDRSLPFNQPARSSMKSSPSDRSISFNERAMSMKSSPSDRSLTFKHSGRSLKSIRSDRSISFNQRTSQDRKPMVQIHDTVYENPLQNEQSDQQLSLVQRMTAKLNRQMGASNG